jgi:hypothetical protein
METEILFIPGDKAGHYHISKQFGKAFSMEGKPANILAFVVSITTS